MKRLILSIFLLGATLHAKPLKVFILAGQSNMEGHAKISSFDHIGMDPKTAPLLKEMRDGKGNPRVLKNVRMSYLTGNRNGNGVGLGPLTAGFGSRSNPAEPGEKIGPEFTFGITMEKLLGEPIVIIKTAWGGKSLNTDFRPPSAGPYEFNEQQIEKLKKQNKDVKDELAKRNEAVGVYYQSMIDHVKKTLGELGKVHPAYKSSEGYELAGFVWFQGWNDMVDSGTYPNRSQPGGYDKYSEVLAHFIRDVRKDLSAPKMPFVIGVMGAGGPTKDYGKNQQRYKSTHEGFRQAMAAPASMPEFKNNVTAVLTENYWDPELDAVAEKRNLINAKKKELQKSDFSKKEQAEELEKFSEKTLTERDQQLLTGITNADYHYKGSAKILGQIGEAFAEANYELLNK